MTAVTEITAITATDSWRRRIGGWSADRFPPAMAVVGLPTFLAAHLLGQASRGPSPVSVRLGGGAVAGWLAAVGFLLCVRIFDEHKDFDDDVRLHPERLVSQGVVRLRELDVMQAVVLVAIVGYCVWADGGVGPVTTTFGIAFAWLLAMRVEFFVGAWIRPRLVLYALTHAVVTPLASWWMFTSGAGRLVAAPVLVPFLGASYLSSLLFEFTRKLHAPEDERADVATYSSELGPARAARVVAVMVVLHALAMATALVMVRGVDGADSVFVWGHALGWAAVVAASGLVAFARRPDRAGHGPIEGLVALNLAVPAVSVIGVVLVGSSVKAVWGW
ncbi:MAG: hypothetical protein IPG46_09305 [Actinobacteria bacterium]|nr:hypothetical protein [Actinomycetota bacterium]